MRRGCSRRQSFSFCASPYLTCSLHRLAGLDGKSSLLVAPQLQYCEGSSQWGVDVQDILFKLSLYSPQVSPLFRLLHAPVKIDCALFSFTMRVSLLMPGLRLGATTRRRRTRAHFLLRGRRRTQLPVVVYSLRSSTHSFMSGLMRLVTVLSASMAYPSLLASDQTFGSMNAPQHTTGSFRLSAMPVGHCPRPRRSQPFTLLLFPR